MYWRINDDSICFNCKHFWHECNVEDGTGDHYCAEYCYSEDKEVTDRFYLEDVNITECKGFEKK